MAEETPTQVALRQQGLVRLDQYEEGAEQWCTSAWDFAASDSNDECAGCGGFLIWVKRVE